MSKQDKIDKLQKGQLYSPVNLDNVWKCIKCPTVINIITKVMKAWRVELAVGEQTERWKSLKASSRATHFCYRYLLWEWWHLILYLEIQRGIKIYKITRKYNPLFVYGRYQDIAKNEKELETLIQAIKICSQDTRMEFSIEKYFILIMKKRKRQRT